MLAAGVIGSAAELMSGPMAALVLDVLVIPLLRIPVEEGALADAADGESDTRWKHLRQALARVEEIIDENVDNRTTAADMRDQLHSRFPGHPYLSGDWAGLPAHIPPPSVDPPPVGREGQ